jgi:putative FmdB family regulatory protein
MPIYEYRRPDGSTFEVLQSFSDEPLTKDPDTGVKVQRVLHAPAVHFKGKGFYNTDYGTRSRQRETLAAGEGGEGSAKESGEASSAKDSKDGSSSKPSEGSSSKPSEGSSSKPSEGSSSSSATSEGERSGASKSDRPKASPPKKARSLQRS